jgi:hypothetical protein
MANLPPAAKRIKEVLHEALPGELDAVIENLHKVRSKLNGNFEYKVKKLNKLTEVLIEKDNGNAKRWRKIATYSLIAFGLMLIGHFIFSYIPFRTMTDETVKWYQTLDKIFTGWCSPVFVLKWLMALQAWVMELLVL